VKKTLAGGAITILKNMKVNGKDDIPYMKWNIKFMFETTSISLVLYLPLHVPTRNSRSFKSRTEKIGQVRLRLCFGRGPVVIVIISSGTSKGPRGAPCLQWLTR
jgi:hypothetical protein